MADEGKKESPKSMNKGMLMAIVLVVLLVLAAGYYLLVLKPRKMAAAAVLAAAEAERVRQAERVADGRCAVSGQNIQPTRDFGNVVCPDGWSTEYNYSINVAADCKTAPGTTEAAKDANGNPLPCNYCIGPGYPGEFSCKDGTKKPWPARPWSTAQGANAAEGSGPLCSGGTTMGYAGSGYVTNSIPVEDCSRAVERFSR